MRRMIPQNQQDALKKLTSKEALLSLIAIGNTLGIEGGSLIFDSDNETYLHISGNIALEIGDGTEFIEIENVPSRLISAGKYPATNSEEGAEFVKVNYPDSIQYPKRIKIYFTAGTSGRSVYFSVLLAKVVQEI